MQKQFLTVGVIIVIVVSCAAYSGATERVLRAPLEPIGSKDVPPACEDGVVLDDGTAETGYGWVPSVVEGLFVQEFHTTDFPGRAIDSVCVCWMRSRADDELDFEIVIFGDQHGTPLPQPSYVIPAQATDVPEALDGAFTEVELGEIPLNTGTFYVGVRWNPSVDQYFFVCADHTENGEPVGGFFTDDRASGWGDVLDTSDPIFANHHAMLIRPVGGSGRIPELPTITPSGGLFFAAIVATAAIILLRRRH